jgi:hypothetical protein
MRGSLAQLEQNIRATDPAQANATRDNILRGLAANNCGPQYAPYATRAPGGILDRLFGPTTPNPFGTFPTVSTYRTLCVRACDGYYFPISFSTTPSQFPADEATCQAQCPGGNAALYVHLNPGEPVEAAVNLTGQPYADLPNAFAFRESYHPSCGCQPVTLATAGASPTYTPIETTLEARLAALRNVMPLPIRRPERSEDPETLANRAGGLIPGMVPANASPLVEAGVIGQGGVRLIGPAYYYAQ